MSKSSLQLVENELIEVREEDSLSWYVARIQKVENRRILVHYLNWHKRHDQWLPARSPRIRAVSKDNAHKLQEEQNKSVMFKVGQAVEARWIDRHYYLATILAVEGNDYYRVLFNDGFKKKLRFSQIRPVDGQKQDDSSGESNRSKRLSARKGDEKAEETVPPSSRSKRLSARLSRNPSDEQTKDDSDKKDDKKSSSEGKPQGRRSKSVSSDGRKDSDVSSTTKQDAAKNKTVITKEELPKTRSGRTQAEVPAKLPTNEVVPISSIAEHMLCDRTATSTPDKEALWTSMNNENSSGESTDDVKEGQMKGAGKQPLQASKSVDSSIIITDKSATHHKIVIDDVIEFEVPKKAPSPAKPAVESSAKVEVNPPSIRSMVESGLKSAVGSGAVFKPRKLELTEPEPIPITDPKSNKRSHASCSNKDNKSTGVSKGGRSKNPGGSGDERSEKKGVCGDRDAMSDHISQLQKNQRDQSARLIAAKGVKDVVYQSAGYNQVAMMGGASPAMNNPAMKPPVYMPHLPGMYHGGTPPYSQYYPESPHQVWGMPSHYSQSTAGSYSPAMSPRTPNMASPHHQVTSSQMHVTPSSRHLVASPHHMMTSPHHTMTSPHHTMTSPHHSMTSPQQGGTRSPQLPVSQQGLHVEYHRQLARRSKSAGNDPAQSPVPYTGHVHSPHSANSPAHIPINSVHMPSNIMHVPSNAAHAGHVSGNLAHLSSNPIHPGNQASNPSHPGNQASNTSYPPSNLLMSQCNPSSGPHTSPAPVNTMPANMAPSNTPSTPCNLPHGGIAHATPLAPPSTASGNVPPKKWEGKPGDTGKQKSRRREQGHPSESLKRGPEEPKQVRKIVKKSGNQAEALKKISHDIYDFPVSLTNKSTRKDPESKSKESDNSEESESSAGEETVASSQHQLPPPYYVNYPFYSNIQGTKITNPIHQMNMMTQQHHAQNRHHLYQQQMYHAHKQRARNKHRPHSPSRMRAHNQAIDANTASLLRHHHMAQQQKGHKASAMPLPYKQPEGVNSPGTFRGLLEEDAPRDISPAKPDKGDGQQPQAYLSVMKLDKTKGQGPLIESYPVHGSFKSTVARAPKLASPKGSQPGSPGSKKTVSQSGAVPPHQPNPASKPLYTPASPAQIQKVSNPARLPPGYEMQQQIYRYPHPIGYSNPAMFKPVNAPAAPPYVPEDTGKIVQPTPILSPKQGSQSTDLKPDDSISAAIQDHLTSDDLWMADDTNFDISDLANYLDGGSNSAIPDDLIEQKVEPTEPDAETKVVTERSVPEEAKKAESTNIPDPAPSSSALPEATRKSLRERRASAKLLENGENIIPPKITVAVQAKSSNIPGTPTTATPSSKPVHTTPSPVPVATHQRKARTSISEMHGASTSSGKRSSPPALVRGVPTSPLKQKLKQYVLERQARQAANRTPPRTSDSGTIDNTLLQRRLSQSPSPTNWQQLIQFGRSSPNFIASLSPRSKQALFDVQCKDSRMSPYCHNSNSPIPAEKKDSVSPKLSAKSPITIPPLFVESKPQIKEEQVEASSPKPLHAPKNPIASRQQSSDEKIQTSDPMKMATSKSVPTTPDGGYNTRKVKVQTFALLGQKPKSRKNSGSSAKHSPRHSSGATPTEQESVRVSPKDPTKQPVATTTQQQTTTPPKSLDLKSPENAVAKTEGLENPFESVFTTTASDIASPFKDPISSQHISTSFDLHFDESELFMDTGNGGGEEVTRPPMQADSDLTTPLVPDITLEGKDGVESFDKKKKLGRPRSKSTVYPDSADEDKISETGEDRRSGRLHFSKSVISETTRASKRARSSSEPFSSQFDDDHRNRKQYYYYGEPKATKAIEPLDDHLEFKCNICKKAFPKQSRLETHLKHYHEGKENVADDESDEKEDMKVSVRCTCESLHEDKLMIQCDECLNWLHSSCIGVNSVNIPAQYICPFCYAIVKQLNDWYEDGNLPSLVPQSDEKPNEAMLDLHSMTAEYDLISKGLTATRLKLDALERSEARRQQDTKDGTWPVNGRKMEGTLVVIPGGGSVLLPNTTQGSNGDPKSNSLVYVLSPGSAKTSTASMGGKTVYTVSRPPLVMSLAQLRQQNPNFRPAAMRGQLRPLSIRPTFRGVQANQLPKQGTVPHMVRGGPIRGMRGSARFMAARPPRQQAPPRIPGAPRPATSQPQRLGTPPRLPGASPRPLPPAVRGGTPPRAPAMRPPSPRLAPRLPSSPAPARSPVSTTPASVAPRTPTRTSSPRLTTAASPAASPRMPGGVTPSATRARLAPPRTPTSANDSTRPPRPRNNSSPNLPPPPRPQQSGPRLHPKSDSPYLPNSRSNSPHLGRSSRPNSPRLPRSDLASGGRAESPRLQRADISQLIAAASNPLNCMVAKQYQDSLAQEISDSQDLLEAHISALEGKLDEFEKMSNTVGPDHSLQLGHVLYDLEQLKILTQTV